MKEKKGKRKYMVSVVRISYAFTDFEVEADTQADAQAIALEQAGNHEFSEKSADYKVTHVNKVKR